MLQTNLDPHDAAAVPDLVKDIATDSPLTAEAAMRLGGFLPKPRKAAYDAAIKIITGVGSHTRRKRSVCSADIFKVKFWMSSPIPRIAHGQSGLACERPLRRTGCY